MVHERWYRLLGLGVVVCGCFAFMVSQVAAMAFSSGTLYLVPYGILGGTRCTRSSLFTLR